MQTQDFNDDLTFGISATDADAGDAVSLGATGLPAGLSFTDNGNRTGTVSGTITATPGPYFVTFTADDHHHASATSGSVLIVVTREETTTLYTGVTGDVLDGSTVTLSGVLSEDGVTPLAGRSLTMTLGSGEGRRPARRPPTGVAVRAAPSSSTSRSGRSPSRPRSPATRSTCRRPAPTRWSCSPRCLSSRTPRAGERATAGSKQAGRRPAERRRQEAERLARARAVDRRQPGGVATRREGVLEREGRRREADGHDQEGDIPDATLQGMIDKLVHADRILAEDAIADAIAGLG